MGFRCVAPEGNWELPDVPRQATEPSVAAVPMLKYSFALNFASGLCQQLRICLTTFLQCYFGLPFGDLTFGEKI